MSYESHSSKLNASPAAIKPESITRSTSEPIKFPVASVTDRKSIEEEVLKNQKNFREDISSSPVFSRSLDYARSNSMRNRNIDSSRSSAGSVSRSLNLNNRVERFLWYYTGGENSNLDRDEVESRSYDSNDLTNYNDAASGDSRRISASVSSHDSRSAVSSRETNDEMLGSVFGLNALEQISSLEELEELMMMEVSP